MARKRSLYKPNSNEPHKLSWSRINNFHNCPRCFYLEETKGIKAPSGPQFLLNSAVDNLYKNEFDYYRKKEEPHPLMIKNNTIGIINIELKILLFNSFIIKYFHSFFLFS